MVELFLNPIDISNKVVSTGWTTIDISDQPSIPIDANFIFLLIGHGQNVEYAVRKIGSTDNRVILHYISRLTTEESGLNFVGLSSRQFEFYCGDLLDKDVWVLGYANGTEFNSFTNAIDITPATTGSWAEIDVSSYLNSSDYNGALIEVFNTVNAWPQFDIRMKGDTEDFYNINHWEEGIYAYKYRQLIVGLDAGKLEVKSSSTNTKIYLLGGIKSDVFTPYVRNGHSKHINAKYDTSYSEWTDNTLDNCYIHFFNSFYHDRGAGSCRFLLRQKGSSWVPDGVGDDYPRQFIYYDSSPECFVTKVGNNNFQARCFHPSDVDVNPFYCAGILDTGGLKYNYYSDLELKLQIESITEYVPIYDYVGNLNLQLSINSLYNLLKPQIYDYVGDLYLQLVPESEAVFSTNFEYTGDLNLELSPNSESFFYFNHDYTGGLNLQLSINSSYDIEIGYFYIGNLELRLSPESIYNRGIDIVGNLEIILSPESTSEADLIPAFRPLIKKPIKILPEIIKLFHLRGERVIVYLSYSRTKDPYEKTKIKYSLNSIAIRALVIDETPSALVWMHGGLKETGAKSLLVEKNDLKTLRVSTKLIIRGEEYVVFKEAEAHRHQIFEWSDYGKIIVSKKGYEKN